MKLTHLRTNHVSTPLGLEMSRPVFTWTAKDLRRRDGSLRLRAEGGRLIPGL